MLATRMASLVIALLLLSPVLSGCPSRRASDPSAPGEINAKTALQVQLASDPLSLDPALAEDGVSLQVLANVMDGLYCFDATGALEACLAEKTEVAPDGKRYEFKLRAGARWSDDRPVLAEDFVRGFRRSLDPKAAGKLAAMFDAIQGARAYREGKSAWEAVGIRAVGSDQLVIELESPRSDFLQLLTLPGAYPAREEPWSETGPSTGAYKLVHRVPDRHIFLDINDACWRRGAKGERPMRPVMLRVVSDESTALSLFEAERLDIVSRVPVTELERAAKLGSIRTSPFLATYYIGIRLDAPGAPGAAERRIWNAAILREPIARSLGAGATPTRTWIPPDLEGYEPWPGEKAPSPPPAGAVKKRKLEATFDGNARNRQILEIIQAQLRPIGVELELTALDWKSHLKRLSSNPAPVFRMGWLTPIRDPLPYLEMLTTGNANNATGFSNAKYDALVAEIRRLAPGPARLKKIREAQRILTEEAPIFPIFHYSQTHLIGKRVKKFVVNPFGVIRFADVVIDGEAPSASQ